jgi:hypothetical protein
MEVLALRAILSGLRSQNASNLLYVMAGLCLEQTQSLHPHELLGLVHLHCCVLTLGKCCICPFDTHVKLLL